MPGSGDDGDESEILDLAFMVLISTIVELLVRGVWPYMTTPWPWVRIADSRIGLSVRLELVKQLLALPKCCSDKGFTLRMQSVVDTPAQIVPDGPFHSVIEHLTLHRVINVKIEDNSARAASQDQASRGR